MPLPALAASACDHATHPEDPETLARADGADSTQDLDLVLPPMVRVPLGGLAEIDVSLREEPSGNVEITADASTPGLVAVPGVVRRFETLGSLRVGATAPLGVGATFPIRVTARRGTHVRTVVSTATVVDKTGSLDPSFGGTGTFVAEGTKYDRDGFSDVEVQPDGSILATGPHHTMIGWFLRAVRVRADGTLDPAFRSVTVPLNKQDNDATAFAVRRQSAGRVVLAGVDRRGGDRIALAGIRPDGALDTAFGDGGVRLLAPDGDAAALALAAAPDDRLVVAGYQGRRSLVARLLPDGAPDPGFGRGGYAVLQPFHDAASQARGVALDGAGRVVVGGETGTRAFIVRLLPDGSQDEAYLDHDLPTPEPTDETTAQAVAIAPDGKILVGGTVHRGGSFRAALWRLLESGEPDPRFGSAATPGLAAIPVFGSQHPLAGFTLLPDGRIVIAANVDDGSAGDDSHSQPFLLRLLPDGTPDPGFGAQGFVRVPLGVGNLLVSIGHTSDEKLVLGLHLRPGDHGGEPAAIARVWG
jgi:uncharacterized delta-60 repeat protein